jgi:hypothetical protein
MAALLLRVLFLLAIAFISGCAIDGGGSGKSYEVDASKIGTGQQAVVPLTDGTHIDGQSMDTRRGR